MSKLDRRALVLGVGGLMLAAGPAFARAPEIYLDGGGFFGSAWTHAVDGHDVVAYFSLQPGDDPVVGSDAFVFQYKGARWRFASQENLDLFRANPEQFVPAYGGYCAWALARDKLAKGAPDVWRVHNGRLFLNVSARFKRKWEENLERDVSRADGYWPGILDRN